MITIKSGYKRDLESEVEELKKKVEELEKKVKWLYDNKAAQYPRTNKSPYHAPGLSKRP
jgi:archaellum component FlaC